MKFLNKKRIISFENHFKTQMSRPRFANVVYDPAITDFEPSSIDVNADVVLFLPDNGMRCSGDEKVPKGSYKITYG